MAAREERPIADRFTELMRTRSTDEIDAMLDKLACAPKEHPCGTCAVCGADCCNCRVCVAEKGSWNVCRGHAILQPEAA